MKRIILLFLFLGLFVSVYAQNIQNLEWTTYLQEYTITDIADAGDYLWLAAGKEVIKFEKATSNLSHYGFGNIDMSPDYSITTIKCSENGLPWVGASFTGTIRMSEDKKWILLPPVSKDQFERGTNEILLAGIDTVWTASLTIISRYCGEKVDTFRTNGSITSLAKDIEGNLWIGTANFLAGHYDGLVKFDGENWTIFNSSPTGITPALGFGEIAIGANGTMWMSGYLGIMNPYTYLIKFDGINWDVYKPNPPFEIPFYINRIVIDKAGIKWLATNQGLVGFDGTKWVTYNESNSGLPSSNIYSILIDADQTKWLGTNKGLVSLKDSQIKTPVKQKPNLVSEFELFPNPAKDFIVLKMPVEFQNSTVDILNVQGKVIKTCKANNNPNRVNVSHFPDGVYLVWIQTDENFILKKFVKQ